MTNINIRHIIDHSTAISDTTKCPPEVFVRSHPCIEIGFFFDIDVSEGRTNQINYDTIFALIDTGADNVYVSPKLIEKYNCPVAVGGESMTVNNEKGSKAHRGSLFIKEQGKVIDLWVMAREFRDLDHPFDAVLGRRFLQFCDLNWNGPERNVTLSLRENLNAY